MTKPINIRCLAYSLDIKHSARRLGTAAWGLSSTQSFGERASYTIYRTTAVWHRSVFILPELKWVSGKRPSRI